MASFLAQLCLLSNSVSCEQGTLPHSPVCKLLQEEEKQPNGAEECCCFRLGCILVNMAVEKGEFHSFLQQWASSLVLCLLLLGLAVTNSSLSGSGDLP